MDEGGGHVVTLSLLMKSKIINDPVHGFISLPQGILLDIIEHPYFQRLRRIAQVSLTHYVYPGAIHTRFHHALGAMHLMDQALSSLRAKGVDISDEESLAARQAILLHDIGHGPFSHTLENSLIGVSHEQLSIFFMEKLNEEFGGALDLAIRIFKNEYPRPFLHELISGQLDMDRMDYLSRDSYFTGVYEGVIGYDRLIKMLDVREDELVVEEKGIYSIEKFLMARRLMYWQVYLHKTVLASELMLIRVLQRAGALGRAGALKSHPGALSVFLEREITAKDFEENRDEWLEAFSRLDDVDVLYALKQFAREEDFLLSFLSSGILSRRLFKLVFSQEPFGEEEIGRQVRQVANRYHLTEEQAAELVFSGVESNEEYNIKAGEIKVLFKSGEILPFSESLGYEIQPKLIKKYYLCFPKG